jgi:hypothetical protein
MMKAEQNLVEGSNFFRNGKKEGVTIYQADCNTGN